MKLRVAALALSALVLSAPSFALDQKAQSDSQIISEIHHKNQGEIALSRLAENRSASDSVLGLARRIVDDHKKADQQAIDLANKNKITISTLQPTKEENELQAKLSSAMGSAFDREYLAAMEKGHKEVISWLDNAEKQVKNSDLKSFITQIMPTLHQHHDLAMSVQKKIESTS